MKYILDPTIKYSTFKLLQETVKTSIKPVQGDRVLWEMLKAKKIYCYFEKAGDMEISLKPPKGKVCVIK